MRINEFRQKALRVTRAGDTFYNRPLADITLFRMELDRAEVEPHTGAFSLKTVLSGRELYEFRNRSVSLRPRQILLVNGGETYASEITGGCRSLSVFYRDRDVAAAARALTVQPAGFLDDPHEDGTPPEVAQVVLKMNTPLSQWLDRLEALLDAHDAPAAEDAARGFLTAALTHSLALAPPDALSTIARRSTRDELLTRVLRARTAIHDRRGRDCALDELAALACLSRYHFLRVFGEAFGETPLAMARRLRLEQAAGELQRGEPPAAVARRAGFRNVPAFRRALRQVRRTGGN